MTPPTTLAFVLAALAQAAGRAPAPMGASTPQVASADQEDARELALIGETAVAGAERAAAIRSYMQRAKAAGRCTQGAAALDEIILQAGFPAWLRRVGADAIATCGDEATARYLAPRMLRGDARERLHAMRAARGHAWQPVLDAAEKVLSDKEPRLRCEAAELLERHRHVAAFERLAEVAGKGKDRQLLEPAMRAASTIASGTSAWPEWERRLEAWSADKDALRRRASIALLLESKEEARLRIALDALADEQWSIRALAVRWLRRDQSSPAVGALVARLPNEAAGSRLRADIDRALGDISGLHMIDDAAMWEEWWRNNEPRWRASGKPPAAKPRPSPAQEGPRLGSGSSGPKFFGVEVRSGRAIYIVDLSGSMAEKSKSAGTAGRTRLEVAKDELLQLVDSMPPGSWFNVVGFHDTVHPWLERIADCAPDRKSLAQPAPGEPSARANRHYEELLARAREHVRRLATGGSTNIYDAFARAFADPDVDTICFMTDGTPTIGTETEAIAIREELVRWNRSRKIRIHCIAVGEDNSLPKWIAADHGGVHRFVP